MTELLRAERVHLVFNRGMIQIVWILSRGWVEDTLYNKGRRCNLWEVFAGLCGGQYEHFSVSLVRMCCFIERSQKNKRYKLWNLDSLKRRLLNWYVSVSECMTVRASVPTIMSHWNPWECACCFGSTVQNDHYCQTWCKICRLLTSAIVFPIRQ